MPQIALIFAINILTSVIKRWIAPKYGKVGVQVFVFLLAGIAAVYHIYAKNIPGVVEFISSAIAFFSLAVTSYEVIWSHVPFLKGGDGKESGEIVNL